MRRIPLKVARTPKVGVKVVSRCARGRKPTGSHAKKLEQRKKKGGTTDFIVCMKPLAKMAAPFQKASAYREGFFLLDLEEVTNKDRPPVRLDLNSSSSRTFIPSERRKFIIFLGGAGGTECDLPFNRRD